MERAGTRRSSSEPWLRDELWGLESCFWNLETPVKSQEEQAPHVEQPFLRLGPAVAKEGIDGPQEFLPPTTGLLGASCLQAAPRCGPALGSLVAPAPGSYRSALQVGERGLFLPQTSQIGLNTGSQASRNESKGLDWIPEMQNLSESI